MSTLPNSVRSRALHRSRFVCNFCNLWMKLCWLFPFSSYETKIPKILTGLRSHFSCNGLLLLFSHFPNQIAFAFFRFNFSLASEPKLSTISKAFSTEARSAQKYSYHLHIGLISVRFLIFQFL